MKTAILILAFVALAAAAPKVSKLQFRNLYKQPVGELKVKTNPRIIGGQEAKPNSIPYQAFLEIYSGAEGWYCGGSVISRTTILTAAHCGEDATEVHATLGAHRPQQNEEGQLVVVSKNIKVHEKWDSELIVNDVSVAKLDEPLTFTETIQAVTLPSRSDIGKTFNGETARVSGWGLTNGFGNTLSPVLNQVDLEVISNRECEEYFGELPESNICTSGDRETGSCSGDSGGPLVIGEVQVGVVSFGIIFCLPGYPSAYARTTSFLDWIENNSDVEIK